MVESSKILTVSYGTFSCTLEGFDDSFSTMKAIAEYFRDLAAGDRYFGAEPPAPDTEMLAKIAEREISRRVEAHSDESGITLRAGDALGIAAPVAAAAPQVEDTPMPPVAQRPDDAPDMEITQANAAATADVASDVAVSETEDAMSSPLVVSDHATPDTLIADVNADDEMDISGDQGLTFAEMARPLDRAPSRDVDSVAAKLQRIRAVVGTDADDDGYIEDLSQQTTIEDAFEDEAETEAEVAEKAQAAAQAEADAAAAAKAEADADAAAQAEAEAAAQAEAEAAAQAEADAAAQAEADAAAQAEADAAEEDLAEETALANEPDVPKPTIRARILRLARPTFTPETTDGADLNGTSIAETSADPDTMLANIASKAALTQKQAREEITSDDDNTADMSDDLGVADAPTAEATSETMSISERIAAMDLGQQDMPTDADDEADDLVETQIEDLAEATDDLAVIDDITETADDAADFEEKVLAAGSLSDEDEADLQQELAEAAGDVANPAPLGRDILPETDDAALTRIMGQADAQLSEPEGNRRRNAIAQLKAAVAATEAARQLGDSSDDKQVTENAFREDFKEVVRPRPASAVPRAEVRTERPKPTPLKLVASQRVDEVANVDPNAPLVLPRRVATTTDGSDADNFAEFAEQMGATELPDLLEAAAAYIAYVEGVEDFSRPQIIKKVQATTDQAFSREDGLRSFGTLLRQGRISKVSNGRFQVSDQTRFKPDQKAG